MPDDLEGDGPQLPADQIPNAAEPKSLRRQRDTAKRREREAGEFWKQVFATPLGRREMWGILASGGAFEERFVAGPNGFPQPEATWCKAGEQRLAFRLYLSWMEYAPDDVALMVRENEPRLAKRAKH